MAGERVGVVAEEPHPPHSGVRRSSGIHLFHWDAAALAGAEDTSVVEGVVVVFV
jgi:hypothetical protein